MNLRKKISKLLSRNRNVYSRNQNRNRRRRLVHEQMEDRRLMAVLDLANLPAQQGTKFVVSNEFAAAIGDFSEVSSTGDINGDGYEDLLVSATGFEGEGRVFLVYGRAIMPATIDVANLGSDGISIKGNNVNHGIGISLSAAGDVNGDGFDDFVIGAEYSLSQIIPDKSESYLIFGGNTLPATLDLDTLGARGVVFLTSTRFDRGGSRVSGAGDVNGDGFDDLIVGAPSFVYSSSSFGTASYIIYGRAQFPLALPLTQTDVKIVRELQVPNLTGISVSGAGDVNGDGFDDLLIGAPLADTPSMGRTDAGASYLIFGAASFPSVIYLENLGLLGVKIVGADTDDQMGRSVSNAGDLNGDGFDDLVIGAQNADAANNAKSNAGESYVIFGRAIFPTTIDVRALGSGGMTISGTDANDYSGCTVSGAGDVNGDGYDDLLVGAFGADGLGNSRSFAGESYVIFGKAVLPATMNLAQLNNAGIKIIGAPLSPGGVRTGLAVSDARDVNGDGFDDVLVDFNVIFGSNDFTSSVNLPGTPNSEILTGTSAADDMVGGRGDDVLIGNGGADVLLGGQGNDVLGFSTLDFRRIEGGTGSNTLRFDGSDLGLKLSDPRLGVFETVDLTGTGNNLLVAKELDILRTPQHTLVVRGNAGDRVNYGSGWAQGRNQVINGVSYYVFTQGTATLKVQVGVTVNRAPVIAGFGGQVTANQNGPAIILDSDVTVTDVDSANFAGGTLTVAITANSEVPDRIEIKNTGNAAGQIGVIGSTIKYSNKIIGTFAGTTTLVVTLNGNATPQAVQALLRNVTFRTSAVSTLSRTVQVSLNDGDGAISNLPTKTVRVIASNVAPVLTNIGGNLAMDATFVVIVPVSSTVTVVDPDSNFYRGTLTLTNVNGQAEDFFSVQSDPLGAIETVTGGGGLTPLVVTFNASANSTAAGVQAVLRAITWGTNSRIEGPRTLQVTLTDGDGGTSNSSSRTINVTRTRIAPVISRVSTGIDYYSPDTFSHIARNATLSVGRLSDFANSTLIFSNQNADPSDLLFIANGPNLVSNGVVIGTSSGGSGLTPLVLSFNGNATREAVESLIRTVQWKTQATTPARSTRTISVSLTLEGLQSAPQSTPIRISYAPEILNLSPTVAYQVAGPEIRVAFFATISGLADRSFANGKLTFTTTQNGETTDLFAVQNEGVGNSQIGVSGVNITYGGVTIGTFTGGSGLSPLVVTFNANATRESVQKLIRTVTWKSTIAAPSLNPRTFSVSLVDGAGLEGSPASRQILLI